jgi:hypothetical protein
LITIVLPSDLRDCSGSFRLPLLPNQLFFTRYSRGFVSFSSVGASEAGPQSLAIFCDRHKPTDKERASEKKARFLDLAPFLLSPKARRHPGLLILSG